MHTFEAHNYGEVVLRRPSHPPADKKEEVLQRRELQYQENLQQANICPEDKNFIYQKRKSDLYRDNVFLECFALIRRYDFLPKELLFECFSQSLKYVYQCKKEQEHKLQKEQNNV